MFRLESIPFDNPRQTDFQKVYFLINKKEAAEQVYIDDEIQLILEQAEKQYKKTKNPAYLAVCLNFALGLRVGKLVALKLEDFSESSVEICGQEIYYIKTIVGKRKLYLSERAKKYLKIHNSKVLQLFNCLMG